MCLIVCYLDHSHESTVVFFNILRCIFLPQKPLIDLYYNYLQILAL